MKVMSVYALVVAIGLISGCSSGESYFRTGYDFSKVDKVAVVSVEGVIDSEPAKNQISDFFVMELLRKGYSPIERAQVQALLKEQKFQATDVTTNEGAARAGEILNVPVVLVVNVPNFGAEMSITAKMVNVEDASILWAGRGSGKTGRMLSTIFGAAAGAGTGAAVAGGDKDDKVTGAVVGGVLGGVAGHALSPQAADTAREIIRKVCRSLPYRTPEFRSTR